MMRPKVMRLTIVTEAPTPHNNYFFSVLARDPDLSLELNYIFRADKIPGRPWKTLTATLDGVQRVRTGLGRWFDFDLFSRVLRTRDEVFFIIGWNHPILIGLILLLGVRRGPLLTWFDTPKLESTSGLVRDKVKALCIRAINRSRGAIFITGKLAKEGMQQLGFQEGKMRMMPFFIAPMVSLPDTSTLVARYSLDSAGVVLLAAGRLIASKGFDIYIQALGLLRQRIPSGWVAILVGSGPEERALIKGAESANLGNSFRLIPWAEPATFNELMYLADVFVAPARFDPFPTTVLSAMQLGKPVIATNSVGSAVEFIESGRNGILVATETIQLLATAMEALVRSPKLRAEIGKQALSTSKDWPVQRGVYEIKHALAQTMVVN
jgi:glycosyltransferase involved in cell wall biosynthesis